jgi:hypothetical protein
MVLRDRRPVVAPDPENLFAIIEAWGVALQIEAFFEDAERRTVELGENERNEVLSGSGAGEHFLAALTLSSGFAHGSARGKISPSNRHLAATVVGAAADMRCVVADVHRTGPLERSDWGMAIAAARGLELWGWASGREKSRQEMVSRNRGGEGVPPRALRIA